MGNQKGYRENSNLSVLCPIGVYDNFFIIADLKGIIVLAICHFGLLVVS